MQGQTSVGNNSYSSKPILAFDSSFFFSFRAEENVLITFLIATTETKIDGYWDIEKVMRSFWSKFICEFEAVRIFRLSQTVQKLKRFEDSTFSVQRRGSVHHALTWLSITLT